MTEYFSTDFTALNFTKPDGLNLVGNAVGNPNDPPILFLHGGGQTRQSWKSSLNAVAEQGYYAIAFDGRGHGESDWASDGDYSLTAYVHDLFFVMDNIAQNPILVGASLGGLTSLLMEGESDYRRARALILVDVAPNINIGGVERIMAFMNANLDGFKSLDEAAQAITEYNPYRTKPPSHKGLARNLRERSGRFYWHWDPAFLKDRGTDRMKMVPRLEQAARQISVPTLLIHSGKSDVVGEKELESFRSLMPQSEYSLVRKAGHMIAGDDNDAFNDEIIRFISAIMGRSS